MLLISPAYRAMVSPLSLTKFWIRAPQASTLNQSWLIVQWPVLQPVHQLVEARDHIVGQRRGLGGDLDADQGEHAGDHHQAAEHGDGGRRRPRQSPDAQPVGHRGEQRGEQDRDRDRDQHLGEVARHPAEAVQHDGEDDRAPAPSRRDPDAHVARRGRARAAPQESTAPRPARAPRLPGPASPQRSNPRPRRRSPVLSAPRFRRRLTPPRILRWRGPSDPATCRSALGREPSWSPGSAAATRRACRRAAP